MNNTTPREHPLILIVAALQILLIVFTLTYQLLLLPFPLLPPQMLSNVLPPVLLIVFMLAVGPKTPRGIILIPITVLIVFRGAGILNMIRILVMTSGVSTFIPHFMVLRILSSLMHILFFAFIAAAILVKAKKGLWLYILAGIAFFMGTVPILIETALLHGLPYGNVFMGTFYLFSYLAYTGGSVLLLCLLYHALAKASVPMQAKPRYCYRCGESTAHGNTRCTRCGDPLLSSA